MIEVSYLDSPGVEAAIKALLVLEEANDAASCSCAACLARTSLCVWRRRFISSPVSLNACSSSLFLQLSPSPGKAPCTCVYGTTETQSEQQRSGFCTRHILENAGRVVLEVTVHIPVSFIDPLTYIACWWSCHQDREFPALVLPFRCFRTEQRMTIADPSTPDEKLERSTSTFLSHKPQADPPRIRHKY